MIGPSATTCCEESEVLRKGNCPCERSSHVRRKVLAERFATADRLIRGVAVESLQPEIDFSCDGRVTEVLRVAVESLRTSKCGGKVTDKRNIPGTSSFENAESAEEHSRAGIFW